MPTGSTPSLLQEEGQGTKAENFIIPGDLHEMEFPLLQRFPRANPRPHPSLQGPHSKNEGIV